MREDEANTDSSSTGNQAKSANEQLDELLFDALDAIDDADGAVEQFKVERQQIEEFAERAAPIISSNRGVKAGQYAQQLSDACTKWTKTEVKERIEELAEDYTDPDDDRPRVTEWLEEHIERVVEVRSTDRLVKTRWRWEAATDYGTVSWETKRTQDGLGHNSYQKLQSLVTEATGQWVRAPAPELRDGEAWAEWIAKFIEEYSTVEPSRGPRTAALDRLTEWVGRNTAYLDMEDAVDRGGMRIDLDNGELHIRNGEIKRWCDAEEIAPTTFQSELSVRGLLTERVSGASEQTTIEVDGEYQTVTYWVFDLDRLDADPYEVVEDPKTATELDGEHDKDDDADGDTPPVEGDSADGDAPAEQEWESEMVGDVSGFDPHDDTGDDDTDEDTSDAGGDDDG